MRKLTPRQRDVLRIIADAGHKGTVLNRNDTKVADQIWSRSSHPGCYGLPDEPELLKFYDYYKQDWITGSRWQRVWIATEQGVKEADS